MYLVHVLKNLIFLLTFRNITKGLQTIEIFKIILLD